MSSAKQTMLWVDPFYLLLDVVRDSKITGTLTNLGKAEASPRADRDGNGKPTHVVAEIQITYVGPQLVKEADIRSKIHVEIGKPFSAVAVDDDVRNLYATGLFYNVHVATEPTPRGTKLRYIIQCNPRLAEVKFAGNSKFSDAQLRKAIRSKVDGAFNDRNLFVDTQAIQEMYEKAGYKGTVVKYSYETDTESGKTTATFVITEQQ
jgi:outer membrane protein insertion porin family